MAGAAQPLGSAPDVRRYQLFINGKFVDSASGKTFESISPHDRNAWRTPALMLPRRNPPGRNFRGASSRAG